MANTEQSGAMGLYGPSSAMAKVLAYLKARQATAPQMPPPQMPQAPTAPASPLPQQLQVPQVPDEVYNASPSALQGLANAAIPPQQAPANLYNRPNGVQGNLVSSGPQVNSMWQSTPEEQAALQAKRQYMNTDSVLEGLRAAQQFKKPVAPGIPQPYDPNQVTS